MSKLDYYESFLIGCVGYLLGLLVSLLGLMLVLNCTDSPIMDFVFCFVVLLLGIAFLIAFLIWVLSQYKIVKKE